MLKLFKKIIKPHAKTETEIIQEIHDAFNNEVNNLLKEASIYTVVSDEERRLLGKAERLKAVGFTSAESVRAAKITEEDIAENKRKENLAKDIIYFSRKYPMNKYINEDGVRKICKKYGLIYGNSWNYIGDIPEKNLSDIEEFERKFDVRDKVYRVHTYRTSYTVSYLEWALSKTDNTTSIDSYCIVAPIKMFNTEYMKVENHKLVTDVKDPIVLLPVRGPHGTLGYLIVTAWGLEAQDEEIFNPNHN